jgi:DNA-binding transcriptional ArsR family regulator
LTHKDSDMSDDSDVVGRLDQMIALMKIGFADSLARVREELAGDQVSSAILEATKDDWVTSGDLQRSVSRSAKVSERTILRALSALAERGLLSVRGSGRSTSYRSAGVL